MLLHVNCNNDTDTQDEITICRINVVADILCIYISLCCVFFNGEKLCCTFSTQQPRNRIGTFKKYNITILQSDQIIFIILSKRGNFYWMGK